MRRFTRGEIDLLVAIDNIRDCAEGPGAMLSSIARLLVEALSAQVCLVFLLDRETSHLELSALCERFVAMLSHPFIALHVAGIQASAGDVAGLEQGRAAIAARESSDQAQLSLRLIDAVSRFARGQYAEAVELLYRHEAIKILLEW